MNRMFLVGLALGLALLTAGGQAQTSTAAPTLLRLQQLQPAFAQQLVTLQLVISHRGPEPRVIGGLLQDTVPCPLFKVFNKAGGPPLIERYILTNCITGENVTFNPGEQRSYGVTLPMKLGPGEYTAMLTLRNQPPLYAQATVKVGPGPFVTDLVLPKGAQAGSPLDLRVAYRNVWGSAVTYDLRLCGRGLLIRDERGQTVYDNHAEEQACTTDIRATTVAAGSVHLEAWNKLPALKAGRYTAIFWGVWWGGAVKRFEVKPEE